MEIDSSAVYTAPIAPEAAFDSDEPSFLVSPSEIIDLEDPAGFTLPAASNQVLVTLRTLSSREQRETLEEVILESGGEVIGQVPSLKLLQVQVSGPEAIYPSIDAVKRLPGVLVATPNSVVEVAGQTSPPSGTGAIPGDWWMEDIDLYDAWDLTKGSSRVPVGVIDNYLAPNARHLAANVFHIFETGSLPDAMEGCGTCDHGTGVSSLAVSRGDDGFGSAGVAWDATLFFADCFHNSDGTATTSDILAAGQLVLDGAGNVGEPDGARLLNLSIGRGDSSCTDDACRQAVAQRYRQSLSPLVQHAGEVNALLFTSAGNTGFKGDDVLLSYSDPTLEQLWAEHVVIVAATDDNDAASSFSREGAVIDIAAPGELLTYARTDDSIGTGSGTSFSSPITMGVGALVWSLLDTDEPATVKTILQDTASAPSAQTDLGAGIVNAYDATLSALLQSGFDGKGVSASAPATATVEGDRQGDRAARVYVLGDLDGDANPDYLVGAPDAPAGTSEEGKGEAYLFYGTESEETLSGKYDVGMADATFKGSAVGDRLGAGATALDDVNGDGFNDFAVLAEGDGDAQYGKVYLLFGDGQRWSLDKAKSITSIADVTIKGDKSQPLLGGTVLGTGDWNSDGLSDVIIGAPLADEGNGATGAVYVFRGRTSWSSSLKLSSANAIFTGEVSGDRAGACLSLAGDLDQDSRLDVLVGAPGNDDSGPNGGKVYLATGSAFGSLAGRKGLGTATIQFLGETRYDGFGTAIATAGDLDGDTLPELMIAAPYADGYGSDTGAVYLYRGSSLSRWTSATPTWEADGSFYGENSNDHLGSAMTGLLEPVSGLTGVAVGAPEHASGSGAVYIVENPFDGDCMYGCSIETRSFKLLGDQQGGRYGSFLDVYPVGDTLTLLVGAPGQNVEGVSEVGLVYVYSGPLSDLIRAYSDASGSSCAYIGASGKRSSLGWSVEFLALLGVLVYRNRRKTKSNCLPNARPGSGSLVLLALLVAGLTNACSNGVGGGDATDGGTSSKDVDAPAHEVGGMVLDTAGRPVPDASIFLEGEQVAVSDQDGLFSFSTEGLGRDVIVLSVEAAAHAPNVLEVPLLGGADSLDLTLVAPNWDAESKISGETGGTIELNEARIDLPGGMIDEETEDPVEDDVLVQVVTYAPGKGLFPASSLIAEPEEEDDPEDGILLQTLGMVGVRLSAEGRPVALAPNTFARVEIRGAERYTNPLYKDLPYEIGDTAPVYHLEDGAIRWTLESRDGWQVEPSTGGDSSLAFVTEVSHFSYWNVDVRVPATCLSGTVFTRYGDHTDLHNGVLVSMRGYTRNGGEWHTWTNTNAQGEYCQRVGADTASFDIWFDKTFDGEQYKVVRYGSTPAVSSEPPCGSDECSVFDHEIPCGWFTEHGLD